MSNIFFLTLTLLALNCSSSPHLYRDKGNLVLKSKINEAINSSGLNTNIGIKILSLRSGKTLYDLNSSSLFNPASNNKIYTSIAALALLDTGYTFETKIYKDENDIYLVGGGDPDFSLEKLDSLAKIISFKVKKINNLILDDKRMDSLAYAQGWMWDEGSGWGVAQISSLSINDNCIGFIINPGELNSSAKVTTSPQSDYFAITNNSMTVNDTSDFKELTIERDWKNRTNIFTIAGNIMDTTSIDTLIRNIHDPTLFFGHLFKESLAKESIKVKKVKKGIRVSEGTLIASHKSESLNSSLKNLMVKSDNLTAELLIKTIGYEESKAEGNWENGLLRTKEFLNDDVKLDTTTLSIKDGSGVSRYNYSSAKNFIKILAWAYRDIKFRNKFIPILSSGTTDETRNLPAKVFYKTGHISAVSNISGYVLKDDNNPIVFSILMNGFKGSSKPYRDLQDKIITIISEY